MARIPKDKAAALHVLGPIKESPYVKPFVHDSLEAGGWIDFERIQHSPGFDNLSTGEKLLVSLAEQLYRGTGIAKVASSVDEASWVRVVEGITIYRGLEEGLSILPGDWIDGKLA